MCIQSLSKANMTFFFFVVALLPNYQMTINLCYDKQMR